MTITIHSTSKIVELQKDGGTVPARVWEGVTQSGIKVSVLVTRIAAHQDADLTQFERELQEQRRPSAEINCWPLRLIL